MNIQDEKTVNDKLMMYCKDTLAIIEARELTTKSPKLFISYPDAAACNQQYDQSFDQEKIVKAAILKWGRKILQHLAINIPILLQDLLGLYILIHVELPFNTHEMPPMKYAMLETVDLFEKNTLTVPIATRILTAGLQYPIAQNALTDDPDIKLLQLSLVKASSGITLPYSKANIPIKP